MSNRDQETYKKHHLIFLVGFMGTGKTHWGKIWADHLQFSFIDLDELIEGEEGLSVHEIFLKNGEDHFRRTEAVVLRRLGQKANSVVACGGGTPCFFDNMNWMNTYGTTVFLRARTSFIVENIKKQDGKRPLVNGMNDEELFFFIESKQKEREVHYSKATIIIDAEEAGINSLDHLRVLK